MHKHWVNVAAVAGHSAGAYAMRSSCKQETKEDVGEPGYRVKRDGVGTAQRRASQPSMTPCHSSASWFHKGSFGNMQLKFNLSQ